MGTIVELLLYFVVVISIVGALLVYLEDTNDNFLNK